MDDDRMIKGVEELATPSYLVVALAVNGSKKTKYVVKWALDKFVPEGMLLFKLFFVRPKITRIPTPMGAVPLSQVREDVVMAHKKDVEWQAYEKLLPFKNMCAKRKVQVEIVQIESDDVVDAIKQEISKGNISKLVIGASSNSVFSSLHIPPLIPRGDNSPENYQKRHELATYGGRNLSARISESIPSFCTVYAISKGKLSSLRASDSETIGSTNDDSNSSDSSSVTNSSIARTEWTDQGSATSYSQLFSPSLPMQRFEALSSINRTLLHKRTGSLESPQNKFTSTDGCDGDETTVSYASNPDYFRASSTLSSNQSFLTENQSWTSDQASTSGAPSEFSSEIQANDINFELEKLRVELRHIRGMYAIAQSETFDASRKLNDLQKQQLEESMKLKELKVKEEEAEELARKEKEKAEAAKRQAECVKDCLRREAAIRKEAEEKALQESREKQKLQDAIMGTSIKYQKFTWEEIVDACSSFSEDLKIGAGGNGIVYKSSFHHTVAAVKVLHSQEAHRTKQFQQELDVLSRIRHPHLLILIGACVDHGCLVYEYMENGSLDERLFRKDDTPPLMWFDRFRIAWEVASALVFLHNAKPRSIIHRDLKPANILLDKNLVSKIGDVGLSTMLQSDPSSTSTIYKDTSPAGTLCYIDPEYQRTGLVSPKSDVYALGMVILQLLTAKPAIALTHVVETAIEDDELAKVVDPEAGEWPVDETKELAALGLSCAELRRKDRPDLKDTVLPVLKRLKEVADEAQRMASRAGTTPPNHFVCPILKDVMVDPCVAADGYTYDRRAIEKWLKESDSSPMTNLPLASTSLTTNYTLVSAIMEWRSRKLW
ncbi:U-box domain-containing protein 35-like [Cynara cardunculus var. scolymus]|uniref:U-box domain-containing protein 35-like n=1 Tax=Cynara cardunculus var. scolymus TaxID=59895 RepID=UPI000D6265FA|nr:U-box domain-containing protein 35-like [Cynara cardunculus var. scolymus]